MQLFHATIAMTENSAACHANHGVQEVLDDNKPFVLF